MSSLIRSNSITKICGLQTLEAAQIAIDSKADLLGVICVPNRKRTVDAKVAQDISALVRTERLKVKSKEGPYLVGVFRNQSVEEVKRLKDEYCLDIVQLHGNEDWKQYCKELGDVTIIKRFIFPDDCAKVLEITNMGSAPCVALFDSEAGGTGEKLDWNRISQWSRESGANFILAGGLTPDNVKIASQLPGVRGVDVSGGVETNGKKDANKIKQFLQQAFQA
ncbi:LADA_0F05952g1_1 [Lachancea dasiensis]|uniref:N-(5'-phosphoribosyl)anthranilate isomerase n=1 Tax=Lachancea dasiensis TaxID=1072105 RepID=A0A1G4JKB3_9SACH|nr:LADA_0F05952g1_1 [Lachancea dasiensis]